MVYILNILIQKKLSIPASNTDLNNFLLLVINGRNDTVEKAELATQERERFDDFSPIRLDKSTLSLKSPAEISDIKLSGDFLESSEDNIDAIYKKLFQISEDIQSIKRNPFYDVREKIDELTFELKKCKKIFDKSTSDFSSISLDSIDKQLRTRLTSSVLLENSFSLKYSWFLISTTRTKLPSFINLFERCPPINPPPPNTNIFFIKPSLSNVK